MDALTDTSPQSNKKQRRQLPFFKKMKGFIQQGASPKALAMSATIGLLLGIFPVLGVTTMMMTAISLQFRLNLALMIGLSYVIYPLQILLIIPFIRFGETLFGAAPTGLSIAKLEKAFQAGFFNALIDLGAANLLAVAGWAALAAPAGVALYVMLVPVFRHFLKKKEKTGAA